jgi:hypothetical protein
MVIRGGEEVVMTEFNDTVLENHMLLTNDGNQAIGSVKGEQAMLPSSGLVGDGVGVVKVTVEDARTVCRGVIGRSSGSRFCSRSRCNITSHKTNKVNLKLDVSRYYIRDTRDQQLFTEPTLPCDWTRSKNDIIVLETAHKSPSIWKIFFQLFDSNEAKSPFSGNQISGGSDDPVIADVTGQLDQIQAAKDVLKTPKRKTRFNPVDEVINIAVETQSIALPKRMKI